IAVWCDANEHRQLRPQPWRKDILEGRVLEQTLHTLRPFTGPVDSLRREEAMHTREAEHHRVLASEVEEDSGDRRAPDHRLCASAVVALHYGGHDCVRPCVQLAKWRQSHLLQVRLADAGLAMDFPRGGWQLVAGVALLELLPALPRHL